MRRRDAIKLGLKHFNTGKPCSKGHFSNRITSSGACIECRGSHKPSAREIKIALSSKENTNYAEVAAQLEQRNREEAAAAAQLFQQRKSALRDLDTGLFVANWEDFAILRELAYNLCLARYPFLTDDDCLSSRIPHKFSNLFKLKYIIDDLPLLRETERELQRARPNIEIEARHAAIIASANQMTYKDAGNVKGYGDNDDTNFEIPTSVFLRPGG